MTGLLSNLLAGVVFLAIALCGIPFIALGSLRLHIFRQQPTREQIETLLNSWTGIVRLLFLGANGNIAFVGSRVFGKPTLLEDLEQLKTFEHIRIIYEITLPYLAGVALAGFPVFVMIMSLLYGDFQTRLLSLLWLMVLMCFLVRALLFGYRVSQQTPQPKIQCTETTIGKIGMIKIPTPFDIHKDDDLEALLRSRGLAFVCDEIIDNKFYLVSNPECTFRVKCAIFSPIDVKFAFNQKVKVLDKENTFGIIYRIGWHNKRNEAIYFLQFDSKKSKRWYFQADIQAVENVYLDNQST
ncbi:MAG: hypothetical protein AAFV98_05760 [Chloroflexota bacterium]